MAWEFNSAEPIYKQLVRGIENDIISGRYPAGSRLASVRDIAEEAKINPNTVQRALAELEARGLLSTQSTNGKFITEDKEVLKRLSESAVSGLTEKYLSDLRKLGLDDGEIKKILEETSKEVK